MSDVEAVLASIAERRPRIIDLSLGRVFAALDRLGAPHESLPPVIHVAGTNGKGSTIAFMRAMLEAAGYSVHVYTSPHLVRFNERIRLAGEEISDAALIDALEECDRAIGEEKLTYFETATCAAFIAFAQNSADFLLLETGLGGRLDATNVIASPLATVITPVALDHQKFLGEKIEQITKEKAGIFRPARPAVVGVQSPAAGAVLETEAEKVGATPFMFGRQWNVFSEHGRLTYQDENGLCDLERPKLVGEHQIYNAGLAVATLRAAELNLSDAQLSAGIGAAHWPARMQRLKSGPLLSQIASALGEGEAELWLDGGHNPHAGAIVAQAFAAIEEKNSRPLVLVAGFQESKDAQGYFAHFVGMASKVYAVRSDERAAADPNHIAEAAGRVGLNAEACPDLPSAIREACARNGASPRILICGSLYLAGEVLRDHI